MCRLGQAYIACGEATNKVELILRRIAQAHGMRRCRVVAFPTAIFITLHDGSQERVTLSEGPSQSLRLDQIADVYKLGDAAEVGGVTPREGLEALNAILKKKPRFGIPGTLLGHMILTAGVSMVLTPSLTDFAFTVGLGLIVGVLKLLSQRAGASSVPLPVIAAAVVSTLVYGALMHGIDVDPVHTLIPPLVTFLPGMMLTLGMVELAYADMVSGASRLISGFVQLVLLTLGLAAGAAIVGVRSSDLLGPPPELYDLPWAPWLGVIIFGIGIYIHFSAPPRSLLWMLVVMLMAFAAQRAGAAAFGSEISGFFGMLFAVPVGYLIQMRFKGPPAVVTMLPSFWLLVPGSLSLLSVARMFSDRYAGLEGLTNAVFTFMSIALGSLVGASIYKGLTEYLGAWRLQIGRAGPRPRTRRESRD
jgi:uncharacterized membrane protein YjjP (DUF1212 family)